MAAGFHAMLNEQCAVCAMLSIMWTKGGERNATDDQRPLKAVTMGESNRSRLGKHHSEPWWGCVCTGRLSQDKAKVWPLEWDHRLHSTAREHFAMAFVYVNEQARDSFQYAVWKRPPSIVAERAWIHRSSRTVPGQYLLQPEMDLGLFYMQVQLLLFRHCDCFLELFVKALTRKETNWFSPE